ncbi:hypothetical protein CC86DRAFT_448175 [Ophiobolus disseminans]|uniref:HTH CENPB-type domain-containing protein n=1 Tax=Ophiobolus disseminans TaxID=1469910 RepID=A0A6A6ZPX9_9PLEO|nr:hypothetical protein CC86DRAFT_448175 [Ophiobolus disseminans]
MTPIEEAIAAIKSRELGDDLVYQEYADTFGVYRNTLARRHQEEELVLYIRDLTERELPPTRAIIQNFTSTIAHKHHQHEDKLISKYTTAIDATRHTADSYIKYKLYFDLLHGKTEEHKILPKNSYNMDKKGFMIGVIGRSKRTFTRAQ